MTARYRSYGLKVHRDASGHRATLYFKIIEVYVAYAQRYIAALVSLERYPLLFVLIAKILEKRIMGH